MAYSGSIDLIAGLRPKNNGTFPLVNAPDVYIDDNTRLDQALANLGVCENVTWSELNAKRIRNQLILGKQYRITDYVTKVEGSVAGVQSDENAFDIIVTADGANKVSESARAIAHGGENDYFSTCDIEAWTVQYCMDNDMSRFDWADEVNGKGVIYRLVDEYGNDCPYDFKNIKFKAYGDTDNVFRYTFDSGDASGNTDNSLNGFDNGVYGNVIGKYVTNDRQALNNIVFKGGNSYHNTLSRGCSSCTFGNACSNNFFGTGCTDIILGAYCNSNRLGSDCSNVVFGASASSRNGYCRYITIENGVKYLYLDASGQTSASQYYQNVTVKSGVQGTAQAYKKISDPSIGQTFNTVYKPQSSEEVEV